MSFQFVPATKQGSRARIALNGTAGAGKTWTALEIAKGLLIPDDARVGLIDTDRGSARKYADVFKFQWLGMTAYNPDDLVRATIAAAEQNIGTLIVDTGSAFWSGVDGMLDRVGSANTNFEGWRQNRPVERRMMDALFGYPGHVIITLRTKAEWVVEAADNGRMAPRRVGTKPDQRDGIEHEFDVVLDLADAGESARVTKTRCPELANRSFRHPGEDVGEIVQAWLDRDAVGEPLNPLHVASWVLETEDRDALRERYEALTEAGQLDAVVYDRDGSTLVAIGELVLQRARELRKAEELAQRQQQQARA